MTTVPGANGSVITFTVSSSAGSNYAGLFAKDVAGLTPAVLNYGDTSGPTTGAYNLINNVDGGGSVTLDGGSSFTFVPPAGSVSSTIGDTTITGSAAGGDTVIGSGMTYQAVGNANDIVMNDGTNSYSGGTSSDDTISGGSGSDTINAGTGGGNVVFDGVGKEAIILQDAAPGGDTAFLQDGTNDVVYADGLNDTVITATSDAQITGGVAGDTDLFVFELNSLAGGGSGNTVQLGAATSTVYDSVGGNTISGSSGSLTFVAGTPASGSLIDSINGSSGSVAIWGADGTNIGFSADTSSTASSDVFYAGAGNETLVGANAENGFVFFGSSVAGAAETVTGSYYGNTTYVTGASNESIIGGSSTSSASYFITGGGDSISIDNWNANDSITADFNNDTVTVTGGNTVITLADNTQITLVGFTGTLSNLFEKG